MSIIPSITSGATGTAVTVALNYVENTDIANGLTLTALAWTDVGSNQTFTKARANSVLYISVGGKGTVTPTANYGDVLTRAVIDSGGTPIYQTVGGGGLLYSSVTNDNANPFSGSAPFIVTGLAAGSHTIKTQMYMRDVNNGTLYLLCSDPTTSAYYIMILEIGG